MSNKRKRWQDRELRVRSVRREPPDTHRIARALLELAQAQAEADAEAEHQKKLKRRHPPAGGAA